MLILSTSYICFVVIFGVYANENFTNINKVDMDELILQTEGVVPLDLADLFREVCFIYQFC